MENARLRFDEARADETQRRLIDDYETALAKRARDATEATPISQSEKAQLKKRQQSALRSVLSSESRKRAAPWEGRGRHD
jgi:hypothetical protein